jgi:ribosomal protein S18 acetylase RimI-like enzyme
LRTAERKDMSMSISGLHRRLSPSDVEELRDLLRICWIDTYTGILPESVINTAIKDWQNKKSLLRGLENPRAYYAGYFVGGVLAGMVSAGKIAPDAVKIFQLYVRPGNQRKGIGNALMDGAIQHFASDAVRKVVLDVEKGNQKGVSFYKKYGFEYPSETVIEVGGDEIPCLVGELLL